MCGYNRTPPIINMLIVLDTKMTTNFKGDKTCGCTAYRKFHSTEPAFLKLRNDILQSLDQN